MDFAFIVHPMNVEDILSRFKGTKKAPQGLWRKCFSKIPAFKYSEISGITSEATGETISGAYRVHPDYRANAEPSRALCCPAYCKSRQGRRENGARIAGLGAMTSVGRRRHKYRPGAEHPGDYRQQLYCGYGHGRDKIRCG